LYISAVLAVAIAASEWLARRTMLRHLGSALLVIVLVAVLANAGLVPTYSDEIAVYTGIFEYLAPLAIFLLLLQVNLRGIARAGTPMLLLFVVGAAGTIAGVFAGMALVGGAGAFGELHHALGGMFVGTYVGGSINFNAIALEYGVVKEGVLYAGAAAVDSAMTTVWMAATVALPRVLSRFQPASRHAPAARSPQAAAEYVPHDTETVGPFDIALLLAMGAAAVWLSQKLAAWLGSFLNFQIPMILILTTLALMLAQLRAVQQLRGARLLGWLTVMVFLAVIGALCDIHSLAQIGALGRSMIHFVVAVVLIHGLIVFGVALVFRLDLQTAAVASQANIGGSTSALALARSFGRSDLVLPAILVGSLGNGIGTYLGFLTVAWLR
jgi:uncharacterized membrane protein